jgi:tetratricopeptide (TPR) repeat protein
MSLAQVGKGHVTAPAIYLIETGRTRPSLPTLEHIARQTGKPVEFFLADHDGAVDQTQASLLSLEAMVADGRNEDAVRHGRALLDQGASAYRLGRIRFLLGQAYMALNDREKASTFLVEAQASFEAVNDGVMLAECIGARAALANQTQPKEALVLADRALSICRSLNPVPEPTQARLLGILAGVYLACRDWDNAVATYEAAIEGAEAFWDLRRLARMYGGLSAAYQELGETDNSARYGIRSVALLEVLRDRAEVARSENSLGLILMTRGDTEGARKHLDRSLQIAEEVELEAGRSRVLISLTDLSLREGNAGQAYAFALQALELAERLHEAGSIAEAHCWMGRTLDRLEDADASDRQFELGIQMFEQLAMREKLIICHRAYAECLERRGELARAYDHMKRALQASRPGLLRDKEREERVSSAG